MPTLPLTANNSRRSGGAKSAVCITLGTGVGAGIVIDGKIYNGSNFGGAEVGHTVISVDGPSVPAAERAALRLLFRNRSGA
ncbi:MAG: ROK family protein [Ruminococcus callidus]